MSSNTFHKEAYRSSLKYFEKYKLKLNSKHFERSDKTDLFTIQLKSWLSSCRQQGLKFITCRLTNQMINDTLSSTKIYLLIYNFVQ